MDSTKKVIALIPAYTHVDHRLQEALANVGLGWKALYECSDLPKARSQLLTFGLERTDADVFVLLDSDIVPTPPQLVQLINSERLGELSAVTAAYSTRDGRCAFVPKDLDATVELGSPGFTELSGGGLGCAVITRATLADIASTLPRITNTPSQWWPFCLPFTRMTGEECDYFPDDFAFWRRLLDVGGKRGKLWLDQELLVHHVIREPRAPVAGPVTRG